jgi:hypothetical protein
MNGNKYLDWASNQFIGGSMYLIIDMKSACMDGFYQSKEGAEMAYAHLLENYPSAEWMLTKIISHKKEFPSLYDEWFWANHFTEIQ